MAYSLISGNNAQGEGTSPLSVSYPSTPATGSLLIAVMKRNSQSGTPGVTDGNSNAFTILKSLNYNTASSQLVIFGFIATASQSKALTTSGAGTHFLDIYEFDYSGGTLPAIGSILDGTPVSATAASGTSTSGSAPSMTTGNANSLLFTAIGWSTTVTVPSFTSATLLQSNASGLIQMADAYQIEASTGTYNPSSSWTSSRAWGQITLALLPGGSVTPPGTPTGLTVSADNEYRARISWTAADALQTNFILQRSTDHATWSTVASPTATYYIDTALSSGTTYYYQVAATNTGGTSSYAAYQSCTTLTGTPPWTAHIQGWIFGSNTFSPHADLTDGRVVYATKPEYMTINGSGVITEEDAPGSGAYAYSAANGITVKNYSQKQFVTCSGSYANFHALMGSSTNQTAGITTLANFCTTHGFSGIELDWEGYSSWTSGDYSTFKTFLSSLVSTFHSNGLKVMVDGPPIGTSTTYTDLKQSLYLFTYSDITAIVDYVCVLAYDYQYDYSCGNPVQPTAWLQAIVPYLINQIGYANLSQLVVGLPAYGYVGATGGFTLTEYPYQTMLTQTGVGTATRDTNSGEMNWATGGNSYWYCDATSLNTKRKTAEDMGVLNISVWYLGGNQWFTARPEPNSDLSPVRKAAFMGM